MLDSPESATLVVTIIPVSSKGDPTWLRKSGGRKPLHSPLRSGVGCLTAAGSAPGPGRHLGAHVEGPRRSIEARDHKNPGVTPGQQLASVHTPKRAVPRNTFGWLRP